MSDSPVVISGTRRQIRELVDGSLEVRIHIDPRFKQDFHRLFPNIDVPIAIAPLALDFERREPEEKPKGGALAQLAGRWCNDPKFCAWVSWMHKGGVLPVDTAEAADFVRETCEVHSRAELDNNTEAANYFNSLIRAPYMEWLKRNPA